MRFVGSLIICTDFFDTFCIGVFVLNILSLSLHKIVRGSAKTIQVKHRFPFLPLLSPFAIFADRMTGAEMEWMESFFVLSSFSDVFLIILFVPVL